MTYDYMRNVARSQIKRIPGTYKQKLSVLKRMIVEYVHENAALVDEIEEVQSKIVMCKEERKFLLRKLCEYEPQVALEVQNHAKGASTTTATPTNDVKKKNKKKSATIPEAKKERSASSKSRRPPTKSKKKYVPAIPLDGLGRPVFPIELGRLTIHSLGEVVYDRPEFHSEDAIYPVGYVSTRIYGSLRDPTMKCMYTCKISDISDIPRFEISTDDGCPAIVGDTPDVCHSLLLQKINDVLSLNVVSTRPRGHEFFGLTHPTVLSLLQSTPGTKRCRQYKWNRFEVSRNGDWGRDEANAGLSFEHLQRSIGLCRYKMAPDVLQKPDDFVDRF